MTLVRSLAKYAIASGLLVLAVILSMVWQWPSIEKDRVLPQESGLSRSLVLSHHLFAEGYHGLEIAKAAISAEASISLLVDDSLGDIDEWISRQGFTPKERAQVWLIKSKVPSPWIRDYGPVPVLQGKAFTLIDPAYPNAVEEEESVALDLGRAFGVEREEWSVYLDGGNILSNGTHCIMSAPLPDAPLGPKFPEQTKQTPMNLKEEFRKNLGCQTLTLIQNPPHEHVDMYAKFVGQDTLLVSEIDEMTLREFKDAEGQIPIDLENVKESLAGVKRQLERHFKVVQIPQPVPFRGTFRTYTNALLVNKVAIVPSYERLGFGYDTYPDQNLKDSYEKKVKSAYEAFGYRVTFVNADALIHNGGALHCVGLQIPRTTF